MEPTYQELAILFRAYRQRIHEVTEANGFTDHKLLVDTVQMHMDRMRQLMAEMDRVKP
jgi:hypothetical protein